MPDSGFRARGRNPIRQVRFTLPSIGLDCKPVPAIRGEMLAILYDKNKKPE
jgi:hypothetical protein